LLDREWLSRLEHILDSIARIERYVNGMDVNTFRSDSLVQDAVLRNFQIIGEAARHIPASVQEQESHIPWSNMQKMRHVIVHDYMRIDSGVIWHTIHEDLLPLMTPLQSMLSEYGS